VEFVKGSCTLVPYGYKAIMKIFEAFPKFAGTMTIDCLSPGTARFLVFKFTGVKRKPQPNLVTGRQIIGLVLYIKQFGGT
jgi:hypothetical protein